MLSLQIWVNLPALQKDLKSVTKWMGKCTIQQQRNLLCACAHNMVCWLVASTLVTLCGRCWRRWSHHKQTGMGEGGRTSGENSNSSWGGSYGGGISLPTCSLTMLWSCGVLELCVGVWQGGSTATTKAANLQEGQRRSGCVEEYESQLVDWWRDSSTGGQGGEPWQGHACASCSGQDHCKVVILLGRTWPLQTQQCFLFPQGRGQLM